MRARSSPAKKGALPGEERGGGDGVADGLEGEDAVLGPSEAAEELAGEGGFGEGLLHEVEERARDARVLAGGGGAAPEAGLALASALEESLELAEAAGGGDEGEGGLRRGGDHGEEDLVEDSGRDVGGLVDDDVVGAVAAEGARAVAAAGDHTLVAEGQAGEGGTAELGHGEAVGPALGEFLEKVEQAVEEDAGLVQGGGDEEGGALPAAVELGGDLDGAGVGLAPESSAGEGAVGGAGVEEASLPGVGLPDVGDVLQELLHVGYVRGGGVWSTNGG